MSLRALRIEHDLGGFELRDVIVEAAHVERRRREEAMAARRVAGRDAVDRELHDLGLFGLRSEGRDDGMQRPHPCTARPASPIVRPSASISATESVRTITGSISASTSIVARPGFSISAM